MISDQGEQACWGSLLHGETAEAIDHLMAHLIGLEQACRAFEPKDLLDALPVLPKPIIEIRAAGNLTMLEQPMPFVPRLGLLPPTTIRDAILKQIRNILMERELIVLGNQKIVPRQPMHLRTERALG